MRANMILFSPILVFTFALPRVSLAEEVREKVAKTYKLGEVVVTATKTERAIGELPVSVSVINRKAIESFPARTADDLLESAVGVDTLESDLTEKTKRSVRLRGVPDQGKTLVLLDGIPLNWPIHGDVEWNEISLENIERIEIVRGPASSLYGSHAMGGVINILTRAPQKRFEGKIKQSYGTHNTWTSIFDLGGRNDRFGYYLYGRHMETDGYYSALEPLPPHSTRNARKAQNFTGRLYWFPDDESRLTLGSLYSNNDRNRGREFENSDRQTAGSYLTYRRDTDGDLDCLSSLYWHTTDYHTEFDKRNTYDCVDHIEDKYSSHWGGTFQLSYPILDWNTLTSGFEYRHNRFHQDDEYLLKVRHAYSEGKQDYWSLYVQDEMAFLHDKFLVTLGLREDWWRSYDGACHDTNPSGGVAAYDDYYDSKNYTSINPKIGLVYHITDRTDIRSSVGKGFQAPNVFRMYRSFQRGKKFYLSNPDLKSEKLISYEVGVDHSFRDDLLARLTFYDSYGDDFIGNRLIGGTTYQVDNFTEVRIWGVEVELKYRVSDHWSSFANYTYNEAKIRKNDPDPNLEGKYLENSPPNKFNLGITYDNPSLFRITALLKYVDMMYGDNENEEKLKPYVTLDIKFQKKIGKNFTTAITCENVFDKEYEIPDHTIQKAPGRFWTFSIAYEF